MAKKEKKVVHSLSNEPIALVIDSASIHKMLSDNVSKNSNHKQKTTKAKNNVSNTLPAPIIEKEEQESTVELIFLGEYYNVFTMQKHPVTKGFLERQARQLREWADLDTSLNIYDYTDAQGYDPKEYYRWVEKYPQIESANAYALRRIGSRRELGAMMRKFAEATIHRTLGYYHDIWRKETAYLAKLKEEAAPQNETKIVVIERFPELPVSQLTPEEVAGAVHKATRDKREYGPQEIWKNIEK